SSLSGDSENLWEAAVSRDWRISSQPRRVTSGTHESQPSVANTGRTAFSTESINLHIWMLPIQANQGKVTGELQQMTASAADDIFPTVSADGKTMAYVSNRSGNRNVWLRVSVAKSSSHAKSTSYVAPVRTLRPNVKQLALTW